MGNLGDFLNQGQVAEIVGQVAGLTGGPLGGLRQNTLASNQKWHLRNITQHYSITSMYGANLHFDLYFCRARSVIPATVTSATTLLAAGFTDAGAVVTSSTPGVDVFMSTRFCEYFKVYKTKSFTVKPGGSFHQFIRAYHKGATYTVHSKVWDAGVYMRNKLSKCIIYRVRAQNVVDSANPSTIATIGQSVFSVVVDLRLEFIAGQYSVPNYQTYSGLTTDLTQTITLPQIITKGVNLNQNEVPRADVAVTAGSTRISLGV